MFTPEQNDRVISTDSSMNKNNSKATGSGKNRQRKISFRRTQLIPATPERSELVVNHSHHHKSHLALHTVAGYQTR